MSTTTTTTTSSPVKVLAVGSAVGAFKELFAKVKAIDTKHGKFELLLCVGDFFGPDAEGELHQLLNDEIEVPIPSYVMQGEHPVPHNVIDKFAKSGSEICKNVFLMSKSALFTTSHGLRIACLGGKFDEQVFYTSKAPLGFSDPYFSQQTVDKLLSNIETSFTSSKTQTQSLAALMQSAPSSHLVDILISNVWPAGVATSASPASNDPNHIVRQLDDVVRRAKPRYHFACGAGDLPQFWEREPYVWEDEQGRVSRFFALGAFGGNVGTGKKPRWFYAFSIAHQASSSSQQKPANATANPFTSRSGNSKLPSSHKRPFETSDSQNFIFGDVHQATNKRPRQENREGGKPPEGYKCRRCESTEHFISDCPERTKPPEGYVCKICNVGGHLVRDCPERHATGDTGGRRPPKGYVCRACASELHLIQDCPVAAQSNNQRGPRARGPPKAIDPSECWFCLSNPNVAKHLIVSIGSECYLTLPKGQIIPTGEYAHEDNTRVPGGGHVLVVPISHFPTLAAVPPEAAPPIFAEMVKYKSALRNLYAKHGCVPVSLEVSILTAKGGHAHVAIVPVPLRLKDEVERAFVQEGKQAGITFEEDPDDALESCLKEQGNYFRVDLPDGRKMVHVMKQSEPFRLQFGRQVVCNLLNMPERLDWKLCAQSESEEREDATAFKEAFAPFDTTQE